VNPQSETLTTGDPQSALLHRRIMQLETEVLELRQALANERHQATVDMLTGVSNRRAYQSRLPEYRAQCARENKHLCLLILDIDRFKSINDRFGHQTGDEVLTCVAQKISRRLRNSDFIARFGGEEFVVLLPDCVTACAHSLAEQLCRGMAACSIETDRGPVKVTLSCGIAQLDPNESDAALFSRADAALYRAKREGRNRACVADDLLIRK
jgi:diguanylate cyclase